METNTTVNTAEPEPPVSPPSPTPPAPSQPQPESQTPSQPQPPLARFPPFPTLPATAPPLIPFSKFKEHGIQIFADPATGIELDGLGIPTVRLRVPHDTDVRKSIAKKVKGGGEGAGNDGDEDEEGEEEELTPKKKKKKKRKKFPASIQDPDSQDPTSTSTSTSQTPASILNRNRKNTAIPIDLSTISDPVERAQEQKRQRLLLFAKQEWWEQWAAGEDLRKGRPVYDSSLPPTDRIHMAATDFRTGRIWPPASTQLRYLWDQFRLYTGLLGSTPVWKRTDLEPKTPINNAHKDDNDNDSEESDDEESFARQTWSTPTQPEPKPKSNAKPKPRRGPDSDFDSDFAEKEPEREQEEEEPPPNHAPQSSHKRIPPRAPYALYAYTPISIPHIPPSSSSLSPTPTPTPTQPQLAALARAQIPLLLSLAAALRHTRLLAFLAAPAAVVREFLSSYVYSQGLVYAAPGRMVGVGRLVLFFLEFVVRVGALREAGGGGGGEGDRKNRNRNRDRDREGAEGLGLGLGSMEREFAKAADVARRAALEIPRAGWIVRVCPEVVGRGCEGLWGRVWREEGRWGAGAGVSEGESAGEREESRSLGGGGDEAGGSKGDAVEKGERGENTEEEEDEETRMKRFEDELRAANVQLVSADPLELGVPPDADSDVDGDGDVLRRIDEDVLGRIDEGEEDEGGGRGGRTPTMPSASIVEVEVEDGHAKETRAINGDNEADQTRNQMSSDSNDVLPLTNPEAKTGTDDVTRSSSGASASAGVDWTRPSPNPIINHSLNPPEQQDQAQNGAQEEQDTQDDPDHALQDGHNPWLPPLTQPLFSVLGSMSALPLRYRPGGRSADVGCAERSVRRVKEVVAARGAGAAGGANANTSTNGSANGSASASASGAPPPKWTGNGMDEALADAFARVVLEPWVDWDDAGCAGLYAVPRVQGPRALTGEEEELAEAEAASPHQQQEEDQAEADDAKPDEKYQDQAQELLRQKLQKQKQQRAKYTHDPVRDAITVLMEPRVAEALSVGMGLVGTWVQLVPVPPPPITSGSGMRGRGRGRGGGRGRGRGGAGGRGGGGGGPTNNSANNSNNDAPSKAPTFWYIEELHMAVPSYWAVPPRGVPGSLLAEDAELAEMFYEAVEAGEGGSIHDAGGGGGGREREREMALEMEVEMAMAMEDEFSD
ncbi:hypothetical protein CVT25_012022 [Psilocybe cyanescens]|uniref:Uncharacterized protein n=1 Tax=Psilocybe cyanescens TaxID=93625 RepID=A0A409XUQ8_PSICY|nr:hypothetical protein CVT25_012022 [Psilocybe cyanescens]